MFDDLARRSRSYRRFDQEPSTGTDEYTQGTGGSRKIVPLGGNLQPLKYVLSSDSEKNPLIFQDLGWAAYLKD